MMSVRHYNAETIVNLHSEMIALREILRPSKGSEAIVFIEAVATNRKTDSIVKEAFADKEFNLSFQVCPRQTEYRIFRNPTA